MAWPHTPLLTFVDDSTPFVTADFLNQVQSAINGAYERQFARMYSWNILPDNVFGATDDLPEGGWRAHCTATGTVTTRSADATWFHGSLEVALTSGHAGVRAIGALWLPTAAQNYRIEGTMQRLTAPGLGSDIVWGLTGETGFGSPLVGDRAHFSIDQATLMWKCVSSNGVGTETTTTTVAIGTGMHSLRIDLLEATTVRFYVDGALVATHAASVPNAAVRIAFGTLSPGPGVAATVRFGPLMVSFWP